MPMTLTGTGTVTGLTAGGLPDASVTTADIADANVTPAKLSQPMTLATAQNTTSGTSIDFTGIPSWVRRITLSISGVSLNSTAGLLVQLGSGSYVTSGYSCVSSRLTNGASPDVTSNSAGFVVNATVAANLHFGSFIFTLLSGTTWTCNANIAVTTGSTVTVLTSGSVTVGGTLDRLRINTTSGTDTFDAGSANILYEG